MNAELVAAINRLAAALEEQNAIALGKGVSKGGVPTGRTF